ncbi:hypothetical protein MON38_13540 [Hymenobacter sp. DH14]|uniref:Uncharacterized protein n=1 Tax=Hymenobacter cyanobacteriorum TaxID=2926463 RepID=A0A9X1VHM7_9BACT|nr:hypothetical protein [Hymenobacter cyanobacteriorum]MCI1188447.1 hypothetical protein [Hymenobacter cyanobacteriorum]
MSELQNPLFDEEKEFLERKKLEYERALRGDVEHIKEQSATIGKVAAVGAGLAGTIWLISKAFGGKKRRPEGKHRPDGRPEPKGKEKPQPKDKRKSAAASAMVFIDHFEDGDHEFGGGVARPSSTPQSAPITAQPVGALSNSFSRPAEQTSAPKPAAPAPAPKAAEKPAPPKPAPAPAKSASADEDPFQDLPYDDSRRLPASKSFDKDSKDAKGVPTPAMAEAPKHSVARVVGSVLQQFLQSDTGKVLVAQAGALALAAVTKKAGEFFPADKNADLADSTDVTKAPADAAPVASPAPSASPDASKSPQSV